MKKVIQKKKYNREETRGDYKSINIRLSPETVSYLHELSNELNLSVNVYLRCLIKSIYVSRKSVEEKSDGSVVLNLWEGSKVTLPKAEVEKMITGLEETFKRVDLNAIKIEARKPKEAIKKPKVKP